MNIQHSSFEEYESTKQKLTTLMLDEVMPVLTRGIIEKKDTYEIFFETNAYLAKKGIHLPDQTTVSCYIESSDLPHLADKNQNPVSIYPCDGGPWKVITGYIWKHYNLGGFPIFYLIKIMGIVCL
jgi:hypothetical protein